MIRLKTILTFTWWIFVMNDVCVANEEAEENAMVDYLSRNNFLQGKAEIIFLLDRSGSVGKAEFEIELGFVESFLTHVVVDVNASRVSVISYSNTAKRHIDYLKEPKSKCFLAQELNDVVYEDSGSTNIVAALEEARLVLKNARPNVNKVIVLVSDGLATSGGDPVDAAARLKAEGVQIFCFGVGRFIRQELESLASSLQNFHTASGFNEFKRLARKIRGDPHESAWSSQTTTPNCDYLCDSIYKGLPNDPGCCDPDARCSCALLSGLHTCVCKPGYFGLAGLMGDCRACPRGTYKSKLEPTSSCTRCPDGSITAEVASTKLSDCYCKEGYAGDPSKEIPCTLIHCPVLQQPANGYILGPCDTTYGSICHFTCLDGYELVDPLSDVRSCQSDGKWTGKTSTCQKIRCNTPQHPEHGKMDCDPDPLTVDKKCAFGCQHGYIRDGPKERICASSKKWTGKETKCVPVTCEVPPRLVHGNFHGCQENQRPTYGESCIYHCHGGFQLQGPKHLTCSDDGTLKDEFGKRGKPTCVDEVPPDIMCPPIIMVRASEGSNMATVTWSVPLPTDNSGYTPKLITNPSNISPGQDFTIGSHEFQYIAIDHANLHSSCTMKIEVVDKDPPRILSCPIKVEVSTGDIETAVHWDKPLFVDNSKRPLRIQQNAESGDIFRRGSHSVYYDVFDEHGNQASCEFEVIVTRNTCPYYPPPDNGALACDPWMLGDLCQVLCNEKYDFSWKPADWYICNGDEWETYPLNAPIPWPDCAKPSLPTAVRQMVGFYYRGDCNDPQVQQQIKKMLLQHIHSSVQYSKLCKKPGNCLVDDVKVSCGALTGNLKRTKRDVSQHPAKEHLELEFEIVISPDEEFNDTEVVLQDFLKTIRDLKWDVDEDAGFGTTLATFENPVEKGQGSATLVVTDEKTTLVCKPGSVQRDDLCVMCSTGTFYDSGVKDCVDCPKGYYQADQGQLECEKCPDGTSTEHSRIRNATLCKGICSPGTYSATGLETCISCPVGKYQDSVGKKMCYDCPTGRTTGQVGATSEDECRDACRNGTFSQNGLEPCQPCPLHHYQPQNGKNMCLECPNSLSTIQEGSTDVNECLDVDPCLNGNTCLNNGDCTREGRNAKCICVKGFEGNHCEKDIDECSMAPCAHGGQCLNTEGSFTCKCLDGFSGPLCKSEIDECASIPCQNNGTCIDKVNGYTCVCSNGYEGINCEIWNELCFKDVLCLNGGACMLVGNDNSFSCVCEPGFDGIDCSHNINECENITCNNNGSCIDGINSFTCACPSGYTGLFCETDRDECENNKCQSGSTCKDLVGTYMCICPPGWNGTHCENKMDPNFILMFPEATATIANMASIRLNSPLTDVTISMWIQTTDTERSGTSLSYAVAGANGTVVDNALTISDCSELKIYVNNQPIVTDVQVADGQWHHLAFTWSSENSGVWALYKDGKKSHEGNNLQPHGVIKGGGIMIIGQEQDMVGGGFSPVETFTGNITRVNIWDRFFSQADITRLYNMDDDMVDKLVAWPDFLQGLKGDVSVITDSKPQIRTV